MSEVSIGLALENFAPAERGVDIERVGDYAVRAEELGFDSLWAWDHVLLGTRRPYPFFDGLSTLAMVATRTERVRLGTGVLVLPLRTPALLAKESATLDHISGGRLTLGLATGWYEREFDVCGVPFKRRGKIFEHNLSELERMWSGEPVAGEQAGIEYSGALMLPRPVQQPRPEVLIGGYVDRVLRRVATRSDGWLTYFYPPPAFATAWGRIQEFAKEAGVERKLTNLAQLPICVDETFELADRRVRSFIDEYFDLPEWSESSADSSLRGTPEQCAEQLAEQLAAGVQRVCLVPCGYEMEQVERIAAGVLPLVETMPVGTA